MKLTYMGRDSWDRPVYKDSGRNLYVDVEPRKGFGLEICTKLNNEFDGEPDVLVKSDIEFVPCRDTWS